MGNKYEKVELPQWLLDELPEPKESVLMSYENGKYVVTPPVGTPNGKVKRFKYLEKAYDYACSFGVGERTDKSFNKKHPKSFISVPSEDEKFHRAIIIRDNQDDIDLIKMEYSEFLDLAKKYRKNKKDFFSAYYFVKRHPAFWTRFDNEKTYRWQFSNNSFWVEPFKNKNNKSGWWIEAGAHIAPDYTEHYHDIRLDVAGKTIEDAYIKLAKKVDKFFNLDGTEKENVKYKKSSLALELEEAMEEIEKGKEKCYNEE